MNEFRLTFRWKTFASIAIITAVAFPAINQLTTHGGETVIVLMPWVCWALLRFAWGVRSSRAWWHLVLYAAGIGLLVGGGIVFLTIKAGATVLWGEIFWATYFAVGLRLAWAVWKRIVEPIGRRVDPESGKTKSSLPYHFLRAGLTAFVFGPLVFGFILHHPKLGNNPEWAKSKFPQLEEVSFETSDGLTIRGWFIPDGDSDTTVIVCHGLGANKTNFLRYVEVTHGHGYNGLIFDFRGHGDSDGHTTTFGLHEYADVFAAVDWLKRERADRAVHVYGIGSSMGAMSLVRAAGEDERIEAVVLDSAFVSAKRFLENDVFGWLGAERQVLSDLLIAFGSLHAGRSFYELKSMPAIGMLSRRPVLLIHGRSDFLFHSSHMDELFKAASEPKERWLGDGLHSNILSAEPEEYQRRVLQFFNNAHEK